MSQVRGQGVTTSTYTPAGYTTTTYEYQGVPQYATSGQTYYREGEVRREGVVREGVVREGYVREGERVAAADIPVESRIEYIPFEKKYVEYEQVEKVYQVPVEYEEIEYEEVVRSERVPYERTITDYYAVETQVEYIRREVEETIMVEEPVERTYERVQYIPVETQIVHYPERENYVPQPTKTRTEYLGIVEKGWEEIKGEYRGTGEVRREGEIRREGEGNTQNIYAQPVSGGVAYSNGSRVGQTTYVTTGSNVNVSSSAYRDGSYQPVGTTTYTTGGYAPTAQTTYVQPGATTYQSGYVTGGSGVRQQGGYVTGGSGVRGSGVRQQATYETSAGLKY